MFLLLIESRLKYLIFPIIIFLFSNNAYALPSFQEVKNSYKKSEVYLLDRHGEIIHEMRIDNTVRRLDWTELKDISPSLIKAVIHSEDRNFYEHSRVDWKALVFSFIKNIFSDKTRGAAQLHAVVSILDRD
jgi:Membrane carboxypeptidase (penicillin-binding protein)